MNAGKVTAMKRMTTTAIPRVISTGVLSAAAIGVVCFAAEPASAQARMVCGERGKIIEHLKAKYGETRRSIGLAEGQGIFEVYASDESGTWTIVLTQPSGKTCLMAAGEAYQALAPESLDTPT